MRAENLRTCDASFLAETESETSEEAARVAASPEEARFREQSEEVNEKVEWEREARAVTSRSPGQTHKATS
jgi:hypothetical protein